MAARVHLNPLKGVFPSSARPATPRAARRADRDYGASARPDWREIDWRRHVRQLELDGRRVNYVDIGEGPEPPVVFVHGLAGSWQNWLENIPRFAEARRVVAMDLPGFGKSEMPAGEISISNYAGFVDSLCDRLGLGAAAVVGNSMGGFIGAEMAISFPKRVERLALVAAAGVSVTNMRRRPIMTAARVNAAVTARTAASNPKQMVSRPRLRHLSLSFVFRHPTLLAPDLLYESLQGAAAPGFMPALEALLSYDLRERLPEIGCPTLLVWGREDVLVPVEDADEFERLIPNCRKVVMDDTGHVPMLERPQTFNELLADFVAEAPARAPDRSAAA